MSNKIEIIDFLTRVKNRLKTDGWVKGGLVNIEAIWIDERQDIASKGYHGPCCLVGAIALETGQWAPKLNGSYDPNAAYLVADDAPVGDLFECIKEHSDRGYVEEMLDVPGFNDNEDTTLENVIEVIDCAIDKAKGK